MVSALILSHPEETSARLHALLTSIGVTICETSPSTEVTLVIVEGGALAAQPLSPLALVIATHSDERDDTARLLSEGADDILSLSQSDAELRQRLLICQARALRMTRCLNDDMTRLGAPLDERINRRRELVLNIATRKQTAEASEDRRKLLQSFSSIMAQMVQARRAADVLPDVLAAIGEMTDVDYIYFAKHHNEPDGDPFEIAADWYSDRVSPFSLEPNSTQPLTPCSEVVSAPSFINSARLVGHSSLSLSSPQPLAGDAPRWLKALLIPLSSGGHRWGLIGFLDYHDDRPWRAELQQILEAISGAIGAVIAREQAVQESLEHAERWRALYRAVDPTLEPTEQLQHALNAIRRLFHMEMAVISRTSSDELYPRMLTHVDPPASGTRTAQRLLRDLDGQVKDHRRAFLSADVDEIGQWSSGLVRRGIRQLATLGLYVEGKLWGELAMYSYEARKSGFAEADREAIELLGRWMGLLLEQQASDHQRQELTQRIQAQQKLESLGLLAGGVAHDFNNLLMAIIGSAELALIDLSDTSAVERYLEKIRTTSENAGELTQQILAYAGRATTQKNVVCLKEMVVETHKMLSDVLPRSADLEMVFDEEIPPVEADSGQLRQVVMNLLTNAVDALEGSPGCVRVVLGSELVGRDGVPQNRLVTETPSAGLYATLMVTDTGVGISPLKLNRIFDPFFSTKTTGRGRGLAAVAGIIRAHGGGLQVDSVPGQGTAFRVFWPVSTRPLESSTPLPEQRLSLCGARVLIVEDTETVREALRETLIGLGAEVFEATHGEQALRVFQAHKEEIDVAILDVIMPGLDGPQLFKALRVSAPDLPVLFVSGYTQNTDLNEVLNEPRAAFIRKPFRAESLMLALSSLMSST